MNKLNLLVLAVSCLSLAACCNNTVNTPPAPKAGPTPCQQAYQRMHAQGITLIQLGDQVKIVIPADKLFMPKSTALQPASYPALNAVADVLLCYKKSDVKIAAYTDNCGSALVNKAVAQQQAQKVEHYLWLHGVNARILMPIGYGENPAVATNQMSAGRAENRRVEITFTRLTQPML